MDKKLLDKKIVDLLEYRIQQEEFSSRLYEDMHLWLEDKGYTNLAKVYKEYAEEEMEHAGWAKKFLLSFGIKPKLKVLNSPESSYETCLDILEATYEHEWEISKQCEEMASEALKMGKNMLYSLALKYCDEQIDELDKAIAFLDIYKLTNDMLVFDDYIGKNYLA